MINLQPDKPTQKLWRAMEASDNLATREQFIRWLVDFGSDPNCELVRRVNGLYDALEAANMQKQFAEKVALRTADALVEAVNEEIQKCCKDVCSMCVDFGSPTRQDGGTWFHGSNYQCDAAPIRERVFQESQPSNDSEKP